MNTLAAELFTKHPRMEAVQIQERLIAALLDPSVYGHAVEQVEKIETHISYVLLAGPHVYKIKKAVDLGFLDFRTLSARRFYCDEELRLNRRLAPGLYLGVVPITGSPDRPVLDGSGPPLEYAVKMRRFVQDQLLSQLLARNALTTAHIDRLADRLAAFHAQAAVPGAMDDYGTPEAIGRPALENFAQLRALPDDGQRTDDLQHLERWTLAQLDALADDFRTRKRAGFVRECHGDFHLGNVAVIEGEVTLFDCLEFSASLRWIDVMNEVAFLMMDLRSRARPELARRFLNRYLEISGDYAGVPLLRFYVVYRALVRAKVHRMRAQQSGVGVAEREHLLPPYFRYLDLALRATAPARPALVLTHGLSGSGKTTHTQTLLETIDAVRVRSDVERKRLQALPALAHTGAEVEQGAYTADTTARTYAHLLDLADTVLAAGCIAIVDATFIRREYRDAFHHLAQKYAVPFAIVDFTADVPTLRARLREREHRRDDASEADVRVLEHQLTTQEPLAGDEQAFVVAFDGRHPPASDAARKAWAPLLKRIGRAAL